MIAPRLYLRALFVPALAWAAASLFAESLFTWAQDSRQRSAKETAIMIGLLALAGALVWGFCRRWPRFLEIPANLPVLPVLLRWVAYIPIFLFALALLFGGIEWIHLRLTGDPTHSQYGLSVLWAAIWYPISLAPAVAVIAAWLDSRRRGRAMRA